MTSDSIRKRIFWTDVIFIRSSDSIFKRRKVSENTSAELYFAHFHFILAT